VFEVSQTEGEPPPELATEATGDGAEPVGRPTDLADAPGWQFGPYPTPSGDTDTATGDLRYSAAKTTPVISNRTPPSAPSVTEISHP
jgi:hypothetical protein